jgi:FeS assembly SUF system protein
MADEPQENLTSVQPDKSELDQQVIAAMRTCFDPEIPVNIYDLGLIYEMNIDEANTVNIKMTLTSPMCPVAGSLPAEVKARVEAVPGVIMANIELVWDPPWNMGMMSEAAKLKLGFF